MRRVSVCLIDDDDWFREMFSQYMMCSCRNVTMSSEDFESWKNDFHTRDSMPEARYDLYIFGSADLNLIFQECVMAVASKSVFLCEREEDILQLKEKLPASEPIFKYTSASKIVMHINFFLSEHQLGRNLLSEKSPFFVISITSCCGGAGKTSLSLTIARMIRQKKNRSALVVSVSMLYDLRRYFSMQSGKKYKTVNEYIYHLFAGDHPETSLDSYLVKDKFGVFTFNMPGGINELSLLSVTEMERFIDSLCFSEIFDVIILDLDNSNDEITGLIAEKSDLMFVLSSADRDGGELAEEWKEYILKNTSGEADADIIKVVINMEGYGQDELYFFDGDGGIQENRADGNLLHLPYDPHSFYFADGCRQISMTGAFAASVDGILKEVISVA